MNIPTLSCSKEATPGYVRRGEESDTGPQWQGEQQRSDRKPGTREGCAFAVSIEDGTGRVGVGSKRPQRRLSLPLQGKAGERASGTLLSKPDALAVKLDFVNWCFKP